MNSDISIRELTTEDWKTYRFLRLSSLLDSPDSFAVTYEEEKDLTSDEWKSKISPENGPYAVLPLVAKIGDVPVGLAFGVMHALEAQSVNIYRMWVSPEYRNRGVARELLNDLVIWAAGLKSNSLNLSVTTTNSAAISLYSSFGFEASGEPEELRRGSALVVQPMELILKNENA
jgi:ribosomal protein S18 acetylase RimI-like enzyme